MILMLALVRRHVLLGFVLATCVCYLEGSSSTSTTDATTSTTASTSINTTGTAVSSTSTSTIDATTTTTSSTSVSTTDATTSTADSTSNSDTSTTTEGSTSISTTDRETTIAGSASIATNDATTTAAGFTSVSTSGVTTTIAGSTSIFTTDAATITAASTSIYTTDATTAASPTSIFTTDATITTAASTSISTTAVTTTTASSSSISTTDATTNTADSTSISNSDASATAEGSTSISATGTATTIAGSTSMSTTDATTTRAASTSISSTEVTTNTEGSTSLSTTEATATTIDSNSISTTDVLTTREGSTLVSVADTTITTVGSTSINSNTDASNNTADSTAISTTDITTTTAGFTSMFMTDATTTTGGSTSISTTDTSTITAASTSISTTDAATAALSTSISTVDVSTTTAGSSSINSNTDASNNTEDSSSISTTDITTTTAGSTSMFMTDATTTTGGSTSISTTDTSTITAASTSISTTDAATAADSTSTSNIDALTTTEGSTSISTTDTATTLAGSTSISTTDVTTTTAAFSSISTTDATTSTADFTSTSNIDALTTTEGSTSISTTDTATTLAGSTSISTTDATTTRAVSTSISSTDVTTNTAGSTLISTTDATNITIGSTSITTTDVVSTTDGSTLVSAADATTITAGSTSINPNTDASNNTGDSTAISITDVTTTTAGSTSISTTDVTTTTAGFTSIFMTDPTTTTTGSTSVSTAEAVTTAADSASITTTDTTTTTIGFISISTTDVFTTTEGSTLVSAADATTTAAGSTSNNSNTDTSNNTEDSISISTTHVTTTTAGSTLILTTDATTITAGSTSISNIDATTISTASTSISTTEAITTAGSSSISTTDATSTTPVSTSMSTTDATTIVSGSTSISTKDAQNTTAGSTSISTTDVATTSTASTSISTAGAATTIAGSTSIFNTDVTTATIGSSSISTNDVLTTAQGSTSVSTAEATTNTAGSTSISSTVSMTTEDSTSISTTDAAPSASGSTSISTTDATTTSAGSTSVSTTDATTTTAGFTSMPTSVPTTTASTTAISTTDATTTRIRSMSISTTDITTTTTHSTSLPTSDATTTTALTTSIPTTDVTATTRSTSLPTTDATTTRARSTSLPSTDATTSTAVTTTAAATTSAAVVTTTAAPTTSTAQPTTAVVKLNLFAYGVAEGDSSIYGDDILQSVFVQYGFPTYRSRVNRLYISTNGYIALDANYNGFSPQPLKTMRGRLPGLVCPFWADSQTFGDGSVVNYHVYEKQLSLSGYTGLNHIFQDVDERVHVDQGVPDFESRWILLVTWVNIYPYPASGNANQRNTFQVVVATDYIRSFAVFLYATGKMLWNENNRRNRPVIGILSSSQVFYNPYSSNSRAFRLDQYPGGNGKNGLWTYRLDYSQQALGPSLECLKWYIKEKRSYATSIARMDQQLLACPCSRFMAWLDWRFIHLGGNCYVQLFTSGTGTRKCCYSRWIFGSLRSSPNSGSSLLRYHPIFYPRYHYIDDELPRQRCCLLSSLCKLYREVRPVNRCRFYLPLFFAFFWGDPHISTLDGKGYTFNGWGEYTLIDIRNKANDELQMSIQGRTERAIDEDTGNYTDATIFTAFAAKDFQNGASVHIELTEANDGFIIYGNDVDYSLQYRQNPIFQIQLLTLGLRRSENKSVIASFTNGVSMNITISGKLLDIAVAVPPNLNETSNTRGLMGVKDDNPDNDFTLPNGTIVDANSTERYLYDNFGTFWQVGENASCFRYRTGDGPENYRHPDFRPKFIEDYSQADQDRAMETCGDNVQCQFDLLATNDRVLANASRQTGEENSGNTASLSNSVPVVEGDEIIRAIVNEEVSLMVNASDSDGDNVTIYLVDSPGNASVVQSQDNTAQVYWIPTSLEPVVFSIGARDTQSGEAPSIDIEVRLCSGCSGHGQCDFNETETRESDATSSDTSASTFQVVPCICDSGWTGSNCDDDYDSCGEGPCPEGTTCTDRPPGEDTAYNCSDCPDGLYLSENKCLDVDECNDSRCEHTCINTAGSFYCSCNSGFSVSALTCADLNECTGRTSGCQQHCNNSIGSYTCYCEDGFRLAADNKTCEEVYDPCQISGATMNCSYACRVVNNEAECYCASGYVVFQNVSCIDIDECQDDPCATECINTDGSFHCSCPVGFQLQEDGSSCDECTGLSWGLDCQNECHCGEHAESCDPRSGCSCEHGFTGQDCDTDIDECITAVCASFETCVNTPATYQCDCFAGYTRVSSDQPCTDIDECADISANDCDTTFSSCRNVPGGFTCACNQGYRQNGTACEDINECTDQTHDCQQECSNNAGSFNCACFTGYKLGDNRKSCSDVSRLCELLNVTYCEHSCVVEDEEPKCMCDQGYERINNTQGQCADSDECSGSSPKCEHICNNTVGGFSCSCLRGYKLSNDKETCEVCDAYHWGDGCSTLCDCGQGASYCNDNSGCVCANGWHGDRCEQDLKECENNSTCEADQICVELLGSYRCDCMSGYSYQNSSQSCADIDECDSGQANCPLNCTNTDGSYTCTCFNGYRDVDGNGTSCIDINECVEGNLCEQNGCENILLGYRCTCAEGFTIKADGLTCLKDANASPCGVNECEYGCRVSSGQSECFCRANQILRTDGTCTNVRYSVSAVVSLNLSYTADLANKASAAFKSLKAQVQEALRKFYATVQRFVGVVVNSFKSGSVEIDHEVILSAPISVEDTEQVRQALITANTENIFVNVDGVNVALVREPQLVGLDGVQYNVTDNLTCKHDPCQPGFICSDDIVLQCQEIVSTTLQTTTAGVTVAAGPTSKSTTKASTNTEGQTSHPTSSMDASTTRADPTSTSAIEISTTTAGITSISITDVSTSTAGPASISATEAPTTTTGSTSTSTTQASTTTAGLASKPSTDSPTTTGHTTSISTADVTTTTVGPTSVSTTATISTGITLADAITSTNYVPTTESTPFARAPCDLGEEYDATSQTCLPCKRGYHGNSTSSGQPSCVPCPGGLLTESTGSNSSTYCSLAACSPGNYRARNNTCSVCPLGQYQDVKWQDNCKQCSQTHTTASTGSTQESDCQLYCPSGYQIVEGQCSKCAVGYYKSNDIHAKLTSCRVCPSGVTTESTGASVCNKVVCQPGNYRDYENTCQRCTIGTYQSQDGQSACLPCPKGTSTSNSGTSSVNECTWLYEVEGGQTLVGDDTLSPAIIISYGFAQEKEISISLNGYVTLGNNFNSFRSQLFPFAGGKRKIVAPFWMDMETMSPNAVLYRVYDTSQSTAMAQTRGVLDRADEDIKKVHSVNDYATRWALVVEWRSVNPFPSDIYGPNENITFQLILATDYARSFALFKYGGMFLDTTNLDRKPVIGYQLSDSLFYNSLYSQLPESFTYDTVQGNTGLPGFWVFSLDTLAVESSMYTTDCLAWYDGHTQQDRETITALDTILPSCPCSLPIMFLLAQFKFSSFNENQICFVTVFTPVGMTGARECCYSWDSFSLDVSNVTGGHLLLYAPSRRQFSQRHRTVDLVPWQNCCLYSGLCHLYTELRPVDDCSNFDPFILVIMWGDPHIQTLDGKTYTFNGWGEYILLNVKSNDSLTFSLQGRTDRVKDRDGNYTTATIFTAFAAVDYLSLARVQVELSDDKHELIVYADGKDLSREYRNSEDMRLDGNVDLRKMGDKTLAITFRSGISLNVSVLVELLDITVTMPSTRTATLTTRGLLGVVDGDQNNDFTLPNGTVLHINSTEEDIFYNFGQLWSVDDTSTVFTYPTGEGFADYSHPDHRPLFLSDFNQSQIDSARSVCVGTSGTEQCIYDYLATLNEEIAIRTMNISTMTEQERTTLENTVPVLENITSIQATVNQPVSIVVAVKDPDSSVVTVNALGQSPSGLTIQYRSEGSVEIGWTPTSTNPVSIRINAKDGEGGISPEYQIPVKLCSGCSGQGVCNFDSNVVQPFSVNSKTSVGSFQLLKCECSPGWTGDECDVDYNVCEEESPCPIGAECIDMHPRQTLTTGFTHHCSSCPLGYDLHSSATKCQDINECLNATLNSCEHSCENTEGSYRCLCNSGYRLVNNLCANIDECAERTSGCDQFCTDSVSSYYCSCETDGFFLDTSNNHTCIKENNNPCGTEKICDYGCRVKGDTKECFCKLGFGVQANGTCTDIDECGMNSCYSICANTVGSFYCSCDNGYKLRNDLITCEECDALHWGANCANICKCSVNTLRCSKTTGCVCKAGWTGEQCDVDVDECETTECGQLLVCENIPGSYRCPCLDGYSLYAGGECKDVDECARNGIGDCIQSCENLPGSFRCVCYAGYQGNGTICQDVDECALDVHECQHQCNNTIGSYNCQCYQGYVLDDDRRTCLEKDNLCAEENLTCDQICKPEAGNLTCDCFTGYRWNGSRCLDIDECQIRCNGGQQSCTNTEGSYICTCDVGYKLTPDRSTCEVCDGYHWGMNCETPCSCGQGGDHCNNTSGCVCRQGWTGTLCDVDVKECDDPNTCPDGQTCKETFGSYTCVCPVGFVKDGNTCADIDECERNEHNCQQKCSNIPVGSFSCLCFPGYRDVHGNGTFCQDINECVEEHGCQQICANTQGGYTCQCEIGFLLDTDKRFCTKDSASDPCVNTSSSCEYGCSLTTDSTRFQCYCPSDQILQSDSSCQAIRNRITASITLNLTFTPDLQKYGTSTFRDLQSSVQESLRPIYSSIGKFKAVEVTGFIEGSVKAIHHILFVSEIGLLATQSVVTALRELNSRGTLSVDGRDVEVVQIPAVFNRNSTQEFSVSSEITCEWNPCPMMGEQYCVVAGGTVSCIAIEIATAPVTPTPANPIDWKLGVEIGVPLFVGVLLAIALSCFWWHKYYKPLNNDSAASSDSLDPFRIGDAYGTWSTAYTKSGFGDRNYISPFSIANWQQVEDVAEREMDKGVNGANIFCTQKDKVDSRADVIRYTPETADQPVAFIQKDDDKTAGNYSWDYVFKVLQPDEEFHIKRPVMRQQRTEAYQNM